MSENIKNTDENNTTWIPTTVNKENLTITNNISKPITLPLTNSHISFSDISMTDNISKSTQELKEKLQEHEKAIINIQKSIDLFDKELKSHMVLLTAISEDLERLEGIYLNSIQTDQLQVEEAQKYNYAIKGRNLHEIAKNNPPPDENEQKPPTLAQIYYEHYSKYNKD